MTFTEGVLRLVRGGVRTDPLVEPEAPERSGPAPASSEAPDVIALADLTREVVGASPTEPGFGDIEAAVALVEAGLASRVVLAGFQSWPGLLWQAYQLAEAADVLIIPTVARPGGRVDIVVTRDRPIDG